MCGLVGIYHKKDPVSADIYDGLVQVQHRGQDAAGIATWDKSKMYTHKELGLVSEVFKTSDSLINLNGNKKQNLDTYKIQDIKGVVGSRTLTSLN